MNWIVFDIETVPNKVDDSRVIRYLSQRKGGLVLSTHPIFSKIIHIGVMWEERTRHFSGISEKEVLSDFWDFFSEGRFKDGLERDRYNNPIKGVPPVQLVSFNGDNFDAPFLSIKSTIHNIHPTVDIETYPYRDFMKSNHFDCLSYISKGRNEWKIKLDVACIMMGIEVPEVRSQRESILDLHRQVKWDQITEKNEEDLELTRKLYLRLSR